MAINKISFKTALMAMFLWVYCVSSSYAEDTQSTYFDEHAQGWHWYDDPKAEEQVKQAQTQSENPVQEMKAINQAIEWAKDKAILYPTVENVKNYKILQDQWVNQSSKFSGVWKEMLLENPELDYSLKHPVNSIGSQVDHDLEKSKQNAAVEQLAKQGGLFFFYRSTCPYCQRFAPILKHFSDTTGITVVPITTDGVSLPDFPNSKVDQGQAAKFGVQVEPALFAVNPYTHKAYPVSYGLMSEDELKDRIFDVATHFTGDV